MIFLPHQILRRDFLVGKDALLHALESPCLIGTLKARRGGCLTSPHRL
jgi:hypothetical protein